MICVVQVFIVPYKTTVDNPVQVRDFDTIEVFVGEFKVNITKDSNHLKDELATVAAAKFFAEFNYLRGGAINTPDITRDISNNSQANPDGTVIKLLFK
jgi:hypothetical protein